MSRRHRRSKVTRVVNLVKRIIAFFFSHVGLCALVVGYALLGAVVFRAVEGPHEMRIQSQVTSARQRAVDVAWNATFRVNKLDTDQWKRMVHAQVKKFQKECMVAIRFLLTLWGMGYLTQFASHALVFAYNTTICEMPLRKHDPQHRSYLIDISVASQLFCESLEIMIASERMISSIHPANYHLIGRNNRLLLPIMILVFTATFAQGYICEVNLHFVTAIAICTLELSSLTMNNAAVKYCGRRYSEMYGRSSLNARYQVKEACELAVYMQRAYLVTFVFKNIINGIATMGTCYMDEEHNCITLIIPMPFVFVEFIYGMGLTASSAFLLCSFVHNHPQLRKKRRVFLSMIWGSSRVEEIFTPPRLESVGDAYFDDLRKAWS